MPRKKQIAIDAAILAPETQQEPTAVTTALATAADQQWSKRVDPCGSLSVFWPDGYRIRIMESDSNREIFIRFGNGTRADQPKAFEAIKKMFKEEFKDVRFYWDPAVQGWALALRPGVTPLIREQNKRTRTAIDEAFYKAVDLEAAVRGPLSAEQAREPASLSI